MYFDKGVEKWRGSVSGRTTLKAYDNGFYLGKDMFFNIETLKMEKGHKI